MDLTRVLKTNRWQLVVPEARSAPPVSEPRPFSCQISIIHTRKGVKRLNHIYTQYSITWLTCKVVNRRTSSSENRGARGPIVIED